MDALTALKLADGDDDDEAGYKPPDYKPPAPPLQSIVRFTPPPADWREEERLRAERDAKPAPVELEPPGSLQAQPAPKSAKRRTPNLDQVKAWRKGKP